jgi:hypothetical protein
MAASYVLFNEIGVQGNHLRFDTKSGILDVQQTDSGSLTLEFPAREVVPVDLRASVEPCPGGSGSFNRRIWPDPDCRACK